MTDDRFTQLQLILSDMRGDNKLMAAQLADALHRVKNMDMAIQALPTLRDLRPLEHRIEGLESMRRVIANSVIGTIVTSLAGLLIAAKMKLS